MDKNSYKFSKRHANTTPNSTEIIPENNKSNIKYLSFLWTNLKYKDSNKKAQITPINKNNT